jgi:hypothetical protein
LSAGFDKESAVVLRRLWPRTRKGWGFVVLTVSTFFVLDALALMGSEIAIELLISLAGIMLGLVSVFEILLIGSALADVPVFPIAESGNVGFLIYGLAFGFGVFSGGTWVLPERLPQRKRNPASDRSSG